MDGFTFWTILLSDICFNTATPTDTKNVYNLAEAESLDHLIDWDKAEFHSSAEAKNESLSPENDWDQLIEEQDVSIMNNSNALYQPAYTYPNFKVTHDMEIKLTQKEHDFRCTAVFPHRWEDINKYPTPVHQQLWNDHCTKVWPAIPSHKSEQTQVLCTAKLFQIRQEKAAGLRYRIYFHTTKLYHAESYYFHSDFIRCDCRYLKPHKPLTSLTKATIPDTIWYFFTFKYTDNEYFLLEYLPGKNDVSLRIASFAEIV